MLYYELAAGLIESGNRDLDNSDPSAWRKFERALDILEELELPTPTGLKESRDKALELTISSHLRSSEEYIEKGYIDDATNQLEEACTLDKKGKFTKEIERKNKALLDAAKARISVEYDPAAPYCSKVKIEGEKTISLSDCYELLCGRAIFPNPLAVAALDIAAEKGIIPYSDISKAMATSKGEIKKQVLSAVRFQGIRKAKYDPHGRLLESMVHDSSVTEEEVQEAESEYRKKKAEECLKKIAEKGLSRINAGYRMSMMYSLKKGIISREDVAAAEKSCNDSTLGALQDCKRWGLVKPYLVNILVRGVANGYITHRDVADALKQYRELSESRKGKFREFERGITQNTQTPST